MHPNAIKLNSSFIPTWTHKFTLEDEGQSALQASISDKEYLTDGVLKSYYIQATAPGTPDLTKATKVCALLAKQLRLAGNPLIYSPIAGVMRELHASRLEREVDQEVPVFGTRGKGYIVIPDFFSNTKVTPGEQWPYRDTEEVGERLMRHVYAGGGLVLGGKNRELPGLEDFGLDLRDAILNRFSVTVVR